MSYVSLPRYAALEFTGSDRVAFLQGQLTQDVALLETAGALRAALLTPAGRVLTVATLAWREESIAMIVPAELAASLLARLGRYVLRSKVRIALPGEALQVAGRALGAPEPRPLALARLADGTIRLELEAAELLLAPAKALAAHLSADEGAGAAAFERAEVAAGIPSIVAATEEIWTAQMLNLDLLGAISFTKGCYTGQEIVARTQHLGRVRRRLFRYRCEAPASIAPGAALTQAGTKLGEVVRVAKDGAATEILAVVGLAERDLTLEGPGGAAFQPLPLPYAIS